MVRGMIAEEERLLKLIERQEDMLGIAGLGRANTATLHVSPDGTGADGLSWRTAYTTLNLALDACSADANALTLILMAPGTYDINEPGQPTWTQNVVLQGSHRDFVTITNTHATASCVLRLEGHAVLNDVSKPPAFRKIFRLYPAENVPMKSMLSLDANRSCLKAIS